VRRRRVDKWRQPPRPLHIGPGGPTERARLDGATVEVRRVQPHQAVKDYVCPHCSQDITAGTGHVVVVPVLAPDLRRHWHHACWERRRR
jgi:hypothetical protein